MMIGVKEEGVKWRRKSLRSRLALGLMILMVIGVAEGRLRSYGLEGDGGEAIPGTLGMPTEVRVPAYFPNIYRTPNASPKLISFTQGAREAMVDLELLDAVKGVSICVQRSVVTPLEMQAWPGCTFFYQVTNLTVPSVDFAFNISNVEANIPYYVNVALEFPSGQVQTINTTSGQIFFTLKVCTATSGSVTISFPQPHTCVPTIALPSTSSNASFTVPSSSSSNLESFFYFSIPSPNTNPNEIISGMDITLANLPPHTQWEFYASANMPVSLHGYDFTVTSQQYSARDDPIVFHITTPSPGVWYMVLIVHNHSPNSPSFTGYISRSIETEIPTQFGVQISSMDNRIVPGPKINRALTLQYFYITSQDGSLDLSLSLLDPRQLTDHMPLPYNLYIAVNAKPGAFNDSIDVNGTNVFADWEGCSVNTTQCTRVTKVQFPALSPSPAQPVTYVIAVLPVGNYSGTQFVLWSGSPCPDCERGVCHTDPNQYGSCECPNGWLLIDCSLWGQSGLTPQLIVIIVTMAIFALIAVACLVYFIYSKRASLFPDRFAPDSKGYERIGDHESGDDSPSRSLPDAIN